MQRSRSPFIAFAVTAMIGRSRRILRASRMVAMPSISGIMMSISTMSMCPGPDIRRSASRPLPAESTAMLCSSSTLLSAYMLRMSSSTISTFLPSSGESD